ncbi:S1 family peptidase [Sphingomonas hylomeconis]|uniref:S1 family peptidase n=1 Tax=Sphingomonas hylomeconis TaxID=1395958 RepID=A0ABV7SST7_9SPHN|nr:S1 family peptidase [Sphingomonas hylomeconis]
MRIPILAMLLFAATGAAAQTAPQAPVQAAPDKVAAGLQPPAPVRETPGDALAHDGAEYARQFGVPRDEAIRRLAAQEASVAATDRLAETYRDRLAGIVIEHRPDYRIVVHLTGDRPVRATRIRAGTMTVPVTFETGARGTREQGIWALTWHQAAIRAALPSAPGIGFDPRSGELVVIVPSAQAGPGAAALTARLEGIAGVPVQLRILNQVDRNMDMAGGARLEGVSPADGKRYVCTTGFTVTDGTRDAIATAAHCLDQMSYRDPQAGLRPLDYVGQWGWGYRDVQINASAAPLPPIFYSDTAKSRVRAVTGQRTRAGTRSGDFVCHRGERTGYSCALVELTDFAPAGDICGGACLPTWVTVAGPTCNAGDSGSPVFSGGTAFGILKGGSYRRDGSCAFYFYMSVDYLPAGWTLLRGADPAS